MTNNIASNSKVLARKWRPKLFKDVLGQEHAVLAFKHALTAKNPHQSYLITGTRGVGKTTLARIFANALNCEHLTAEQEPCLKCYNCLQLENGSSLNYLELDGASHNGVDEIRSLLESVPYLPISAIYKIYVIDEVHMLSNSAFNALLKTLEEPPKHVVFIFATTDPQKIPETILSRCIRLDLRAMSAEQLKSHLQNLIQKEHIQFESSHLLDLLTKVAKGSVRDMMTTLDQLLAMSPQGIITEETMMRSLGRVKTKTIQALMISILTGEINNLHYEYQQLLKENIDWTLLAEQIIEEFYEYWGQILRHENTNYPKLNQDEVSWLLELLLKDLEWAIKSFAVEKAILAVLSKLTLRYTLSQTLSHSPNLTSSVHPSMQQLKTAEAAVTEEVALQKKNPLMTNLEQITKIDLWENILHELQKISPALANYWLNTDGSIHWDKSLPLLSLNVTFLAEDSLLYEQFNTPEHKNTLLSVLRKLYDLLPSQIVIDIKILPHDETGKNFSTLLQKEQNTFAAQNQLKEENVRNNKTIKQIEAIFNAKIDKVLLK